MKEITITVADHIIQMLSDAKQLPGPDSGHLTKTEIKTAQILSEYHPGYISVVLTRLVKKGVVIRPTRATYALAGGAE